MKQRPALARQDTALVLEIRTVQPLWTDALRRECAPARRRSPGGFFAKARTVDCSVLLQGCGAGHRRTLFALAKLFGVFPAGESVKTELLAFPMAADRLVREPSVVAQARKPLRQENGSLRFADPVSDHDFWFEGTTR